MNAARRPGPTAVPSAWHTLDAGTLARWRMPAPGPASAGAVPVSTTAHVSSIAASEGRGRLQRGSTGAGVAQVQRRLALLLPAPSLSVDGVFGAGTEGAVRRFQLTRGLAVDGVVGPRTWRALLQPASPPDGAAHARPAGPEAAVATPMATAAAGGDTASWMRVARGELGQHEVGGAGANPRIVAYHATTGLRAGSDEVPWCSSFVNWVLAQAGIAGTASARAASWIGWGRASEPVEGAVTVIHNAAMARSSLTASGNHVGFLVEQTQTHWVLLGGNQSDQVKESAFRRSRWQLRGCRWPT